MKNRLPAENGGIADNGSQLGHGLDFTAHSIDYAALRRT